MKKYIKGVIVLSILSLFLLGNTAKAQSYNYSHLTQLQRQQLIAYIIQEIQILEAEDQASQATTTVTVSPPPQQQIVYVPIFIVRNPTIPVAPSNPIVAGTVINNNQKVMDNTRVLKEIDIETLGNPTVQSGHSITFRLTLWGGAYPSYQGVQFTDVPVTMTAPDSTQTLQKNNDDAQGLNYLFTYTPVTTGSQVVTFTSGDVTATTTITVN